MDKDKDKGKEDKTFEAQYWTQVTSAFGEEIDQLRTTLHNVTDQENLGGFIQTMSCGSSKAVFTREDREVVSKDVEMTTKS